MAVKDVGQNPYIPALLNADQNADTKSVYTQTKKTPDGFI